MQQNKKFHNWKNSFFETINKICTGEQHELKIQYSQQTYQESDWKN